MKTQVDAWRPPHDRGAEGVFSASLKTGPLDVAGGRRTDAPAEPAPTGADQNAGSPPIPAEMDRLTGLPVPLRFPWLCGGALALEDAAGRRAPFGPGPVLGELVDTSA